MAVIRQKFSEVLTPSIIDTEYIECNFSRLKYDRLIDDKPIGIRIFPGDDTPRTFIGCNLINCEVPPNSTLINCNTTIGDYLIPDNLNNQYKTIVYGKYKNNIPEYLPIEKEKIIPYRTEKIFQIIDTGIYIKPEIKVVVE